MGCDYDQERIERPKGHQSFQWIQTVSGEGMLKMRGQECILKEGTAMLLFPNEPHTYYKTNAEWKVYWIILEGVGVADFVRRILGLKQSEICNVKEQEIIFQKVTQLYDIAGSNEPLKNLSCSTVIYSILMDILKNATFHAEHPIIGSFSNMDAVIEYINHHYAEVITLDMLAAIADLTPQYLCTLFKRYTSQTVFQYINMVRVSKSKELLVAETNMPIKEIAWRTGFQDVSYFCKVFRKLENKSPLDFRRLQ